MSSWPGSSRSSARPGKLFGAALLLLLSGACVAASGTTVPDFQQLLDESGLRLTVPAHFDDVAPQPNSVLPYERALRHEDGALEIRYAVRPLARLQVDYQDPHSAAPEPNHLFAMMFQSITQRLAAGGHSPHREYPSQQARELFNADWAAASVFDVDPEFSDGYRQGLLIAMHRRDQADAYVVYLYNDYPQVQERLRASLSALSFVP